MTSGSSSIATSRSCAPDTPSAPNSRSPTPGSTCGSLRLSKFLKRCLEHALSELAHEPGRELDPKLARFEDLLLKDSSVVRLHASLAKKWPATRSRKVAAG